MRKIIAIFLASVLWLTGCSSKVKVEGEQVVDNKVTEKQELSTSEVEEQSKLDISIKGLDDETLLRYVEDNIYQELVTELNSADYFVENVEAIYYPKEYIEALSFNTQDNRYFGYTVAELDAQFKGTKYVFTLGKDGQTCVVPMETLSDDVYVKALEDVIIGSGVILVCVTVSVVAAPTLPAVSMIFAASATTGTKFALESGGISFLAAAIAKGYETENFEQAMKAGVEVAGEGFKWGAFTGALVGGGSETISLKGATRNGLTMNEAALIQKESGFPLDVIKEFRNMEQYNICKNAGLKTEMVSGKTALIRKIDLNYVDEATGLTNLELMKQGLAPIEPATGKKYQLHHIGQKVDSTLAILTEKEHKSGGNDLIWHIKDIKSEVHANGNKWNTQRQQFWLDMAEIFEKGVW